MEKTSLEIPENGDGKERIKAEKIALAKELVENHEGFPFPGLTEAAYAAIKASENDPEYPDYSFYATPIDTLIERCKKEGIKVVFSADPESGNIFILPRGSTDVIMDNLLPKHLQKDRVTNDKLKGLILLDREQG